MSFTEDEGYDYPDPDERDEDSPQGILDRLAKIEKNQASIIRCMEMVTKRLLAPSQPPKRESSYTQSFSKLQCEIIDGEREIKRLESMLEEEGDTP
jgi:hypothetical protein